MYAPPTTINLSSTRDHSNHQTFCLDICAKLAGQLSTHELTKLINAVAKHFHIHQFVFGNSILTTQSIEIVATSRKQTFSDLRNQHTQYKLTKRSWKTTRTKNIGLIDPDLHPDLHSALNLKTQSRQTYFFLTSSDNLNFLAWRMPSRYNEKELDPYLIDCLSTLLSGVCNWQAFLGCDEDNQHLRQIINTSNSVYATWHEVAGWQYHNVQGFRDIGIDVDNMIIHKPHKNNPMNEDDWLVGLPLYKNLIENGVDYQNFYRLTSDSGNTHWYLAKTSRAEANNSGGSKLVTSVSREITQIKQAQIQAEQHLQREKWITKVTHQIFSAYDFASLSKAIKNIGLYLNGNRCSVRIVDPETQLVNLIGEWHTDDLQALASIYPEMSTRAGISWVDRLAKFGKAFVINNADNELDGANFNSYYKEIGVCAAITQPIVENGALVGIIFVGSDRPRQWQDSDISLLKIMSDTLQAAISRNRLIDDLQATEDRVRMAMQNSTHSLWHHYVEENILVHSPQFYSHLGYSEKDKSTDPVEFFKLVHPDDRHKFKLSNYQSESSEISIEFRVKRKNGDYCWLLGRGTVVQRDNYGNALHVAGINLEINDIKETQQKLRIAQESSELANQNKGEFLERMSHEIRTPMNAILGMSFLALDKDLSPEATEHLEDIEGAAKSLLHIIDDILDFSKIESGELTITKKQYDLHHSINKLIQLYTNRAEQAGNSLNFVFANDVPQYVLGDENRINQVVTNLLSNAIKFTNKGEINLSIQIAEVDRENETFSILFSVSDTGIGLTKEQQKGLFNPFTQADQSTTRKYGGTGLGLSICKHLVEMMGGSIHAISLPQRGTTFHFTIQFENASVVDLPTDESSSNPNVSNAFDSYYAFDNKHVLLAEDNIVNQRVATGLLNKFGIKVTTVGNGQEAIDTLTASDVNCFDAVLMDIEMPTLDGLSATSSIRKLNRFSTLPIIAMTAHAMVGDRERCLEVGMNDHIPKPIRPQTLLEVLTTVWNLPSVH